MKFLICSLLLTLCLSSISNLHTYYQQRPPLIPQQIYCPISYPQQSSSNPQCCDKNTIQVFGSSQLSGKPDQALINVEMRVQADTVENAVQNLAHEVKKIIFVLKDNGLSEENYETTSFNVYPKTQYINKVSTVIGQVASQSFQINTPLKSDGSNLAKLIDELAVVNDISIRGVSFDIQDKTNILRKARVEAFKNAFGKASDYTNFAGIDLGKVLKVTDNYGVATSTISFDEKRNQSIVVDSAATTIKVGNVKVSYNVEVTYQFGY